MFEVLIYIAALLVSYLIGSINSSIIICKIMTGEDIRNHGSGNAGATNALRTLGKKAAAIVFLFDALKAVIAILIARIFCFDKNIATYLAGVGVVLGHNYPIWFGFKGGKGIVVSLVAIFFADYNIAILVTVISLLIMAISKYVSLGSVLGAIIFFLFVLIFKTDNLAFLVFAFLISGLAIFRHRSNIVRLLKGKENKLKFNKG